MFAMKPASSYTVTIRLFLLLTVVFNALGPTTANAMSPLENDEVDPATVTEADSESAIGAHPESSMRQIRIAVSERKKIS